MKKQLNEKQLNVKNLSPHATYNLMKKQLWRALVAVRLLTSSIRIDRVTNQLANQLAKGAYLRKNLNRPKPKTEILRSISEYFRLRFLVE